MIGGDISPKLPGLSNANEISNTSGTLNLSHGGTNAVLTASNGAVAYSTSTALALTGVGSTGQIMQSNGAGTPTWSTPTYPAASITAGKVLVSDGTNIVGSTPTFPNASATSLKHIRSDGTNWIATTATISDSPSTAGKMLVSDGTNWITSTPTFPNASATTRKIVVSDGTNWTASTETYAVPGTSGNIMQSDGTNWTSVANASTSYLVLLATNNPSAVASTTFSGLTTTYRGLFLQFSGVAPATNTNTFVMTVNSDVTVGDYFSFGNAMSSAATNTAFGNAGAAAQFTLTDGTVSNLNGSFGVNGYMFIQNPDLSSPILSLQGAVNYLSSTASTSKGCTFGGVYQTGVAITSIVFKFTSGNITSGQIKLYGIL